MSDKIPVDRELLLELRDAANDGRNNTTNPRVIEYYAEKVRRADALLEAPVQQQQPVAWIAGCYRDAIEGRTDRIPLGVECSLVNLNWLGQIPLYVHPAPADAYKQECYKQLWNTVKDQRDELEAALVTKNHEAHDLEIDNRQLVEALEALCACIMETRGPNADKALNNAKAALAAARVK